MSATITYSASRLLHDDDKESKFKRSRSPYFDLANDTNKSVDRSEVISTHPYKPVITRKDIDFNSINEVLQKVFKHDTFRSEIQRDAITEACQYKRDLFVSLPTGSGKSLIYQLPALYQNNGLAIVVSPLVALINNQIQNAKKLGIPSATINSHMTKAWNNQVRAEIASKDVRLRLLYLTPETLCSDYFQSYLNTMNKNRTLKLFAIDEAHCVSSWGHEFRPDYLKLANLRTRYPSVPIIALTATATQRVLDDILDLLSLDNPRHFIASTFRENLYYDVKFADKLGDKFMNDLANFIKDCLHLDDDDEDDSDDDGTGIKKKKSNQAVGSQFVSAATLLADAKTSCSKSSMTKKSDKRSELLAKEQAKITLFFKPKPVGVQTLGLSSQIFQDVKRKTSGITTNNTTTKVLRKDGAQQPKQIELVDICDDEDEEEEAKDANDSDCLHKSSKIEDETSTDISNYDNLNSSYENNTNSSPSKTTTNKKNNKCNNNDRGVGIVYCRTKLNCEDVANTLNRKGISARAYHSSMSAKARQEVEQMWMDERVLVICATISFGMGIDKPNVRVVVHFNMSQSLANYYQESGRAGRDGLRARCRIYYQRSDENAIMFLLHKDAKASAAQGDRASNQEQPGVMDDNSNSSASNSRGFGGRATGNGAAAIARFERMLAYCKSSSSKCRHLQLASEFALSDTGYSSNLSDGCKGSCDHCDTNAKSSPSEEFESSFSSSGPTSKWPRKSPSGASSQPQVQSLEAIRRMPNVRQRLGARMERLAAMRDSVGGAGSGGSGFVSAAKYKFGG